MPLFSFFFFFSALKILAVLKRTHTHTHTEKSADLNISFPLVKVWAASCGYFTSGTHTNSAAAPSDEAKQDATEQMSQQDSVKKKKGGELIWIKCENGSFLGVQNEKRSDCRDVFSVFESPPSSLRVPYRTREASEGSPLWRISNTHPFVSADAKKRWIVVFLAVSGLHC